LFILLGMVGMSLDGAKWRPTSTNPQCRRCRCLRAHFVKFDQPAACRQAIAMAVRTPPTSPPCGQPRNDPDGDVLIGCGTSYQTFTP
jgi:hypothetical protein